MRPCLSVTQIAENYKVARKHNRGYHAWNLQIDWDEIKMRIQEAVNRALISLTEGG